MGPWGGVGWLLLFLVLGGLDVYICVLYFVADGKGDASSLLSCGGGYYMVAGDGEGGGLVVEGFL